MPLLPPRGYLLPYDWFMENVYTPNDNDVWIGPTPTFMSDHQGEDMLLIPVRDIFEDMVLFTLVPAQQVMSRQPAPTPDNPMIFASFTPIQRHKQDVTPVAVELPLDTAKQVMQQADSPSVFTPEHAMAMQKWGLEFLLRMFKQADTPSDGAIKTVKAELRGLDRSLSAHMN